MATLAALRSAGPVSAARPPALHSLTVALTSADPLTGGDSRTLVDSLASVLPGTRIHQQAQDRALLQAAEQELLSRADSAARSTRLTPTHTELLHSAALDLHVLSAGLDAPVAGWSGNWRYVWPRDAAHAAIALALLGAPDRALTTMRTLLELVGADGRLEARYIPGTARPPDDRPQQLDGTGWVLWALDVLRAIPATARATTDLLAESASQEAIRRATSLLLRVTAPAQGGGADRTRADQAGVEQPGANQPGANQTRTDQPGATLPPPSPDYWEVPERRTTIATAALTLVGLQRGARLLANASAPDLAHAAHQRAGAVEALIHQRYGPARYGRYPARPLRRSPADTGMLFLLPPYTVGAPDPRVTAQIADAEQAARRPAGGVAPGAGWKRDGISWTPQTALFAQAHAHTGAAADAARLLDWLATHRTAAGSLPEKVLADGSPAAVAPLAWTAAVVVMALLGTEYGGLS